jgi:hypothetical protein
MRLATSLTGSAEFLFRIRSISKLEAEKFGTLVAMAGEIGNSLGQQMPELFAGEAGAGPAGAGGNASAIFSVNGHLIMGRRPMPQVVPALKE